MLAYFAAHAGLVCCSRWLNSLLKLVYVPCSSWLWVAAQAGLILFCCAGGGVVVPLVVLQPGTGLQKAEDVDNAFAEDLQPSVHNPRRRT
jgi:hypothetical protein